MARQEPFRYRIWYPECHFDLSVKVNRAIRLRISPLIGTQHIILLKMLDWAKKNYPFTLFHQQISVLMYPRFREANIVTAICGFVGSVDKHLKQHAYMCHLVRRFSGGFEMRSRFWIGRDIRINPFIGSAIVEKLVNTRIGRMLSLSSKTGWLWLYIAPKNITTCRKYYLNSMRFMSNYKTPPVHWRWGLPKGRAACFLKSFWLSRLSRHWLRVFPASQAESTPPQRHALRIILISFCPDLHHRLQ